MNRRSFNKMLAAAFGSAAIGLTPNLLKPGPKIDFAEWCDLERYRWSLEKPFIQSGHQIATDGRVLLRLPSIGDIGTDEDRRVPDLDQFQWDLFDCRGWKPWPALEIEKYGVCVSSCRGCRGYGLINWRQCDCPGIIYDEYDNEMDKSGWCGRCDSDRQTGDVCPVCNGKDCNPDEAARIGDAGYLNTRFDSMIRDLGDVEYLPAGGGNIVSRTAPHAAEAIAFRFDGGVGLVMPLNEKPE